MTNPVIRDAQRVYLIATLYADDVQNSESDYEKSVAYSALGNCILDLRDMFNASRNNETRSYMRAAEALILSVAR